MPDLDAALEVTLTATVECSEYARAARRAARALPDAGEHPKRVISPEARERMRQGALAAVARKAAATA